MILNLKKKAIGTMVIIIIITDMTTIGEKEITLVINPITEIKKLVLIY